MTNIMGRLIIFLLCLTAVSCAVVKRRELAENEEFINRNEEFNNEETTEKDVDERNKQTESNGGEDIDEEKINEKDEEQNNRDRSRDGNYTRYTSKDIKDEEKKLSNAENPAEIEKTLERREAKETEDRNKPVESPKPDKEVKKQKSETKKDETKDGKKGNKDQPKTILYLMPLLPLDQTLYPLLPYLLPLPIIYVK